jgi:hypothetical protein
MSHESIAFSNTMTATAEKMREALALLNEVGASVQSVSHA